MSAKRVEELANAVSAALEARLGVKGPDLARQLRKLGRRLPQAVRKDIAAIADAKPLLASPKLVRQVNLGRLEAAERRIQAHLKNVDYKADRVSTLLGIAATISFALITLGVALLVILRWRGFV